MKFKERDKVICIANSKNYEYQTINKTTGTYIKNFIEYKDNYGSYRTSTDLCEWELINKEIEIEIFKMII